MPARLKNASKVVGAKQTLKALQQQKARTVFIAKDAEQHVLRPILESCTKAGVEVIEVETMAGLGQACGIQVSAAVAAIIE